MLQPVSDARHDASAMLRCSDAAMQRTRSVQRCDASVIGDAVIVISANLLAMQRAAMQRHQRCSDAAMQRSGCDAAITRCSVCDAASVI
jgi:hypothetical protein